MISSSGPLTACPGSQISTTLNASSLDNYTVNWYFEGALEASNQPSFVATKIGKYSARYQSVDGCVSNESNSITIVAKDAIQKPSISVLGATQICPTGYQNENSTVLKGIFPLSSASLNSLLTVAIGVSNGNDQSSSFGFGVDRSAITSSIAASGKKYIEKIELIPIIDLAADAPNYQTSCDNSTKFYYVVSSNRNDITDYQTGSCLGEPIDITSRYFETTDNTLARIKVYDNNTTPDNIYIGYKLKLYYSDDIPNLGFKWFKDGTLIPNSNAKNLTISEAGSYTFSYSLECGESMPSDPTIISAGNTPIPVISTNSTKLCAGQTFNLNLNLPSTSSIKWEQKQSNGSYSEIYPEGRDNTFVKNLTYGDVTKVNVTKVSATTAIGSITLRAKYTLSSGCYAYTEPITLTFEGLQDPSSLAIQSVAECYKVGRTFQFDVLNPNNLVFGGTWSVADPSIATINQNGQVTVLAAGTTDILYSINCVATPLRKSITTTTTCAPGIINVVNSWGASMDRNFPETSEIDNGAFSDVELTEVAVGDVVKFTYNGVSSQANVVETDGKLTARINFSGPLIAALNNICTGTFTYTIDVFNASNTSVSIIQKQYSSSVINNPCIPFYIKVGTIPNTTITEGQSITYTYTLNGTPAPRFPYVEGGINYMLYELPNISLSGGAISSDKYFFNSTTSPYYGKYLKIPITNYANEVITITFTTTDNNTIEGTKTQDLGIAELQNVTSYAQFYSKYSSSNYNYIFGPLAPKITILDNETAVFTANLAASSVYEGENGTANLNINIFPFWSQYHQLFVKAEIISDDGTELTLGTSPLFFEYKNSQGTKTSGLSTSLNFSTLKDNIRDGDQNVRVRFTIEKMNYGNWNGSSVTWDSFVQSTVFTDLTAEVVVNVVDIDVPLIKVSETKKSILEGTSSTVAVSLTTQPTGSVTVNASSLSKFTLSPTSLTFTNSNWNTPQTVTINGIDNSVIGSNASETLVFSDVASVYQNSPAVTLDLLDNDATLIITDLKTGVTSTINDIVRNTFLNQKTDPSFKVVLPVKPTQNVKVSFSTNGFGTTATTNSRIQGLIQPIATLTFTPDNWNIPQVVNIISNDKDASGNSISFFNNYITSLTVATTADSDPSYLNLSYKLDLSIKITSVNITSSHTWTNRKEYLIKQYSNASPLPTQDSRLDNCEMLKNGQSAIWTLPYSSFSPTDPSKLYLKLNGPDGPIYTTLNQSDIEYGWVPGQYPTSRVLSMPLSTQVLQELIAIGSYSGNTGGIQLPLVVKEGEIANDATNITHGTITTLRKVKPVTHLLRIFWVFLHLLMSQKIQYM